MRYLLAILILNGCAGGYESLSPWRMGDPPVGADAAIETVKSDFSITANPPIYWYTKDLNCADGRGWIATVGCIDGVTVIGTNDDFTAIALPAGWKIHQTSLAHELTHVMLNQQTGDPDQDHLSKWFTGTWVSDENAKLASEGF